MNNDDTNSGLMDISAYPYSYIYTSLPIRFS